MVNVHTVSNGPILEMTLDRPPANAIVPEVSVQLHEAYCRLRDDPNLRVGVITGHGDRIFCAGWDMKHVASASDPTAVNDEIMDLPGGFAGVTEFWDLNKPVIAAVNGAAVGGGFEIALAADIIVAAEGAHFSLPEMKRGFIPDAGAIQRLPQRVPYNVAMEMLLTGRVMSAAEAHGWGLVHQVTSIENLMETARKIAMNIAEGAPLAVEALLEVVPKIHGLPIRESFARLKRGAGGLPSYERMMVSEDFLEGPRAFAEGRKPDWKGR